ncbi:hypothetical protein AB0F15_44575 [Amycolatopsis sp. NPDC026612]|uniref:hypothetical protein n=1 Tax=Amycolatopsis sp. NPDC026612 TaxID=3155466 RepID=UPI0033C10E97
MSPRTEMGIVLLAICALLVTTVFAGSRLREKTGGLGQVPPPAPEHARRITALRGEDYDLVLRGGAIVNGVSATWPFASLLAVPGRIGAAAVMIAWLLVEATLSRLLWIILQRGARCSWSAGAR